MRGSGTVLRGPEGEITSGYSPIYYANETRLNDVMQHNYEVVSGWLSSDAQNAKSVKIADQFDKDANDSSTDVDAKILAIKKKSDSTPRT